MSPGRAGRRSSRLREPQSGRRFHPGPEELRLRLLDLRVGSALEAAEIDLPEVVDDRHGQPARGGERLGRLPGAGARARDHGVVVERGQLDREPGRMLAAGLREADVEAAVAAPVRGLLRLGMAHEREPRHATATRDDERCELRELRRGAPRTSPVTPPSHRRAASPTTTATPAAAASRSSRVEPDAEAGCDRGRDEDAQPSCRRRGRGRCPHLRARTAAPRRARPARRDRPPPRRRQSAARARRPRARRLPPPSRAARARAPTAP